MTDLATRVEQAKQQAAKIQHYEPIFVRVLERDGRIIWSKVDDQNRDLTAENSDGQLYHLRSLFVPHGAVNPLSPLRAREGDEG